MMDDHKKRLMLYGGVAVIVLLLVLKSKSGAASSGAGIASQAAATDPNQQAAQALNLQAVQADFQRQQGLLNLQTQGAANNIIAQQASDLGKQKIVACPSGGVVRAVPNGQGGLSIGCVVPSRGPSFLDTLGGIIGNVVKVLPK